jgi:hypothetical protein
MATLALNVFVIIVVASPLMVLEFLRSRSAWIEANHEGLGFLLWIVVLIGAYLFVLPRLGLVPNPRIFE